MLEKKSLIRLYIRERKSVKQISDMFGCSQNKVTYWLKKYDIRKRSIADALYSFHNPHGDPFRFRRPKTNNDWFLYGLGLGLFWGEGNKVNTHAVRLGNSDPALVRTFIRFLSDIYCIQQNKLRFGLQLFSDISTDKALSFWCTQLGVSRNKFLKVVVTPSKKSGSYRKKNAYGVLTVYFSNVKLRGIIVSAIEELRTTT